MKNIIVILFLSLIQCQLYGQNVLSIEDWHTDLNYLVEKLKERHANLFHTYNEETFSQDINELKDLAGSISEKELVIRISELIANVGDAHTFLDIRNQKNWKYKRLPLDLNYFEDGLFVVGANKNYKHLIGNEIVSINNHPIDTVISKVKKVGYNENSFTQLISVSRFIVYPDVLKRFGFINSVNSVTIEFQNNRKITKSDIISVEQDSIELVQVHENATTELPLTYRKTDSIFWYDYNHEDNLLYIQINKCTEDETHRFNTLSNDIVKTTSEKSPGKLVVDLRRNVGGNSRLTYPLIYALTHFEKTVPKGQIFIITGRWTLSASIVLCDEINKFCNPIFIGEPTGAAPNLYGENSYWLTLPRSKLEVSYSSEWFQSAGPFVNDLWIAPDIYLPIQSEKYFNLEEPILDRIRSFSKDTISYHDRIYDLAMLDSINEAVKVYEAYKSNPENIYQNTMTSIRRMANQMGRNGKLEYSLKFHELNVRDNPTSVHAMLNLSQCIEDVYGVEKARSYYLRAKKLLSTDTKLNEYLRHYFEDYIEEVINQ